MGFAKDKFSTNAMGGTELMKYALEKKLNPSLLEKFQIFVSRVHEPLDENRVRILWLHDIAEDPENNHLLNGGWKKFHKLVFATNWQMNHYIQRFAIPWPHCVVLQNAIEPIPVAFEDKPHPKDGINLIYHTTPHRGLEILVPVFKQLRQTFLEKFNLPVTLDVYSSFKIYGWAERDEQYERLFVECSKTEGINYHGSVSNEKIREALVKAHVFAYPSIWPETSCIALMEALSAGVLPVHPNYGALYETAANLTHMYQWTEDLNDHAGRFLANLEAAIYELYMSDENRLKFFFQLRKSYTDIFYNWDLRIHQWDSLLKSLENTSTQLPTEKFIYRTT